MQRHPRDPGLLLLSPTGAKEKPEGEAQASTQTDGVS
jgi:hypothetical protein